MPQLEFEKKKWEIPDGDSACRAWQLYFKELKRHFGKDQAKHIWLVTWNEVGSASCLAQTWFNKWQKHAGLDVGNAAFDIANSTQDMVTNFFGMGANVTKLLRYGVPVALGLLMVGIFYRIVKSKDGNVPLTPMQLLK